MSQLMTTRMQPDLAAWSEAPDEEIVKHVLAGEAALYEVLMRRYNQRLYRVARSILRDDSEAEDVMQESYVRAWQHLSQFAGDARFSTWLTKIAVYEALGRVRKRGRTEELDEMPDSERHVMAKAASATSNPESQTYGRELRLVLESAVESLPGTYRAVFVLRSVEGLSVNETAECLGISEEAVKTRQHRARALLRKDLEQRAGLVATEVFPFHLSRCDRVVDGVFRKIISANS